MIAGEQIEFAFKTIRDQLIFTNKRIISIDVQGITGKRKSYATMPYSKNSVFCYSDTGIYGVISGFRAVYNVQQ